MRAFIAIPLPLEIKDYLASLEQQLKTSQADVKWVEPENIHLTLKFLGERNDKKIEKILEIMQGAAKDKPSFLIRLSSLGAFPRIDSPRIIWVGIQEGTQETEAIALELEEKIARLGIPKEDRPFSSHITIGRTRSNKNLQDLSRELNQLSKKIKDRKAEFTANQIVLFKSTLSHQGPIYETFQAVNLKTS